MTLATACNLARVLADLGETGQAQALAEDARTRWRQLHGDDHRETHVGSTHADLRPQGVP